MARIGEWVGHDLALQVWEGIKIGSTKQRTASAPSLPSALGHLPRRKNTTKSFLRFFHAPSLSLSLLFLHSLSLTLHCMGATANVRATGPEGWPNGWLGESGKFIPSLYGIGTAV